MVWYQKRIAAISKKVIKAFFPFPITYLYETRFHIIQPKNNTTDHNGSNIEAFHNAKKQMSSKQILRFLGWQIIIEEKIDCFGRLVLTYWGLQNRLSLMGQEKSGLNRVYELCFVVSEEEQKKEKWEMWGKGLKGGSKGSKAFTWNNQICLEARKKT